jgi:protein MpaA
MPRQVRLAALLASVALAAGTMAAAPAASSTSAAAGEAAVPDASHAYSLERAGEVVERRVIGTSVRGRDIVAYRKGNPDAARTVLVLGQMHGDEPAGPLTARYLRTQLRVDSDVDVWIIPTMNPDGRAAGTRRNARGVDLNRNWPTTGWAAGSPASITYGGPSPRSEPETRAMIAFLRETQPDWITSIHQPFGSIGRNGKTPRLIARLSENLGLPREDIGVGTPDDKVAPTLSSWYNANFDGGAVTVEFVRDPTAEWLTTTAGPGILGANLAAW